MLWSIGQAREHRASKKRKGLCIVYTRGGQILKKLSAGLRRAFITVYGYPEDTLKIWTGPARPPAAARPRPVSRLPLRAATPKSGHFDLGKKFY